MFPYIAGAIAGAAYGAMIGYIKYTVLWKRVMKSSRKITTGKLYQNMGISYAINVVTLLAVFLLRDQLPWNFMAVIASAALMLSIIGKLAPISEIVNRVEEKA